MTFKDYFSDESDAYASARPAYPEEFFSYLSSLTQKHDAAWDCATGTGQAAIGLAPYYRKVCATDASSEQIAKATPYPGVAYSVQPAEATCFPENTFDILTVATALHWFDRDLFFCEARRVLKPNGILAVFGYSFFKISPEIDQLLEDLIFDPISEFWSPENQLLWDGYRNIDIPIDEIECPSFDMRIKWTLEETLQFIATWTATKRYHAEVEDDLLGVAERALSAIWDQDGERRDITMKIYQRIGNIQV